MIVLQTLSDQKLVYAPAAQTKKGKLLRTARDLPILLAVCHHLLSAIALLDGEQGSRRPAVKAHIWP